MPTPSRKPAKITGATPVRSNGRTRIFSPGEGPRTTRAARPALRPAAVKAKRK